MKIHDIVNFVSMLSSSGSKQHSEFKKPDTHMSQFITTYKNYVRKLDKNDKQACLLLFIQACYPQTVDWLINLLGENDPSLIKYLNEQQTAFSNDMQKFTQEEDNLPADLKNSTPPTNNYGFNRAIYEQILPLTKLVYHFEQDNNTINQNILPQNQAYKLAVMFGSKEGVLKYLQAPTFKNNLRPLHDACLYTLPTFPPAWDISAWRALAQKNNNLAENKKFSTLLHAASKIEQQIFDIQYLGEQLEKIKQKLYTAKQHLIELKKTSDNLAQKRIKKCNTEIAGLNGKKTNLEELIRLQNKCQISNSTSENPPEKQEHERAKLSKLKTDFLKAMAIDDLDKIYLNTIYNNAQKNPEAARIFKAYRRPESAFNLYLTLAPTDSEVIPNIIIKGEELHESYKHYYLKKLDPQNPMAACLGEKTGCCQSLGEVAQSCTVHGITDPEGGFYVICKGNPEKPKDNDEIIAQTWAWRGQNGALVFDSIEYQVKTLESKKELIADLYTLLAHKLVNEFRIPRVMVGTGGNTPNSMGDMAFGKHSIEDTLKNYKGYRDSYKQRIMAIPNVPIYYYPRINSFAQPNPTKSFWENIIYANFSTTLTSSELGDWIAYYMLAHENELEKFKEKLLEKDKVLFENLLQTTKEMHALVYSTTIDINEIKKLRKKGASLEIPDEKGNTILHKLCSLGTVEEVKTLCQLGAIPTTGVLIEAVMHDNLEIVEFLAKQPSRDLHATNERGNSLLLIATDKGHLEIVKLLITKKLADINVKNNNQMTALMLAINNGHLAMVKFLLDQPNIDLHATDERGNSPLLIAAGKKHLEIVKLLITKKPADINVKNNNQMTALMLAINNDHLAMVKFLLDQPNIQINLKSNPNPLQLAVHHNHVEIIKLLLKQPSEQLQLNKRLYQLLKVAANKRDQTLIKFLAQKVQIKLNVRDEEVDAALITASDSFTLEALIQIPEMNINVQDQNGNTLPMLIMKKSYSINAVRTLFGWRPLSDFDVTQLNKTGESLLSMAISKGDLGLIKLLLQKGRNTNLNSIKAGNKPAWLVAMQEKQWEIAKFFISQLTEDQQIIEALFVANHYNQDEIAELLINMIKNPNTKLEFNNTILNLSASYNQLELMKKLMKFHKNIELNEKNNDGYTALMLSILAGNIEMIEHLLLNKLYLNFSTKNNNGNTAVMLAVMQNNSEIVNALFSNNKRISLTVDYSNPNNGNTPLMIAVVNGNIEIIQILVRNNANLNLQNKKGKTALIQAIEAQQWEVVKFLLQQPDIDPSLADANELTPLLLAAHREHWEIVKELLDRKDSKNFINKQDISGETALTIAIGKNNLSIATLLLQQPGIELNTINTRNYTPLMIATKEGSLDMVTILAQQPGIQLDFQNEAGETAFLLAVEQGHLNIAELLAKLPSVNLNKANAHGNTPLMIAAKKGNLDMVKFLARQPGINLNATNKDGDTALILATQNTHIDTVEFLVSQTNIDPTIQNKYHQNALFIARHYQRNNELEQAIKNKMPNPNLTKPKKQ